MHSLLSRLVRVVLSIASPSLFVAASSLPSHALSGGAAGPASAAPTSRLDASPASGAPSATTLSLISNGAPVTSIAAGTPVTLTAKVTAATAQAAVTPGLVLFCDASAAHCEDSAVVGTGQLTAAGKATVTFIPGIGSHSYRAVFVGTHAFVKSSSGVVTLSVAGKNATTTTITSSGPYNNATLSATVLGFGLPAPTGEVAFKDITDAMSLGTLSLDVTTASQVFSSHTTNGIPGNGAFYPSSQLFTDVNGDGIKDLVQVQPYSGVVVLLGKGDGTFSAGSTVFTGNLVSVVAGDFNSDGITDLAVGTFPSTDPDNPEITVLLGQVGGTFMAKKGIVLSSSANPPASSLSIVVADVNGDGVPDLVADLESTLYVLFGTGSGDFSIASTTVLASPFYTLYSVDLNGDGIPDLAGTTLSEEAIAYLGSASGTFTSAGTQGTALSSAVADFNGDGIPDLALIDDAAGSLVTVLLGNGDGTFTLKSKTKAATYPANAIVAADFNGDGIQDLVVNTFTSTALLLGNGDGTFEVAPPSVFPNDSFFFAEGFAIADLNGDGLADVFGYTGSGFAVALNGITNTGNVTISGVSVPVSPTQYVTAAYSGDTENAPSTSASLVLSSTPVTTSLQLTSSPATSTYGNLVTLTARLSPYAQPRGSSNGDGVTFYSGSSSIGTGILASGVATFQTTYLPAGTDQLTAVFAGDANANLAASTSNHVTETVTGGSGTSPGFVVSVHTDDSTPSADNCAGPASSNCSLRDAIAAAAVAKGGNITFSPTVFAASQPISARIISLMGLNSALILPSNTTITGPTTGSGATLTPLVTVTPPPNDAAFKVAKGTTGVAISGLSISGANFSNDSASGAEAVSNDGALAMTNSAITGNATNFLDYSSPALFNDVDGTLTLTNCTISDNFAGMSLGAGIENNGTLVVTGSTITGNSNEDAPGAGIANGGTATLTNTIVSGNQIQFHFSGGRGGGIYNAGTLNLVDSSVTGNSASLPGDGSGIYITPSGTLRDTKSTIISNISNYNQNAALEPVPLEEDDCDGPRCPAEPIPAPPVFSQPSGTYTGSRLNSSLSDTTPGSVFFYTVDGSTPTTSSFFVGAGEAIFAPPFISPTGVTTVKAIAFTNGEASTVATATYTLTSGSACTLVDYSAGFTPAGLTLNRGATVQGSLLQLTDGGLNEARSAFYSTLVPVTEFTTDFQFQLLNPMADGITFTIQSAGPDAVGKAGGGLGYAGIPKSVALKFDLYNNSGEGTDSLGFYLDGAYPYTPALNLAPFGIYLHSGHVFAAHITFVGGMTKGTITDLTTYQSYTGSIPGDLTQVVGDTAYIGFTGGTGGLSASQNILTWTYGGGPGCGTPGTP